MALIKCPECGKEISELSENCIGCGFPISKFLSKQKANEEIQSIDIKCDCEAIRNTFTEFRNSYIALSNMKIDINHIKDIVKNFDKRIAVLSIDAQKEARGKFVESFCMGICENSNLDVLNFSDIKSICDIINIKGIPEQSITNITNIIFEYSKAHKTYELYPLSWLMGQILIIGSDADKNIIELILERTNSSGNVMKDDVMDIIHRLDNRYSNSIDNEEKATQFVPKCPTCQSTNIKKVSTASKAGSVFMWGLLSQKVKKQWHCNNCGYEW